MVLSIFILLGISTAKSVLITVTQKYNAASYIIDEKE